MSSAEKNAKQPIPLNLESEELFLNNKTHAHRIWLTESFHEIKIPLKNGLSKWVIFSARNGEY